MFDGLLGRKFQSKCKTLIKQTKTRIDMIKRKRKAVEKYLRNDIADLLRNGLDINAYGRAGGLLVEMNRSTCYDFVEQYIECISSHVSVIEKQRECPEECKEAVPSLMYAAARFADLPELRDFRSIFTQRYGNSLEAFINKEFVEKLRSEPPTKDMKLQLMQEIAHASSIEFDLKALEQKLYNPPPPGKEFARNESIGDTNDDKDVAVPKRYIQVARSKVNNVEEEVHENDYTLDSRREKKDLLSPEKPGLSPCKDFHNTSNNQDGQQKSSDSTKTASQEEAGEKKPFFYKFINPPYFRPKAGQNGSNLENPPTGSDCNKAPTEFQTKSDHVTQEGGAEALNGHVNGEENHHLDYTVGETKKPRSVRRKNLKPPPGSDNVEKKGLQMLSTDDQYQKDEEERIMDDLLLHYSMKPSPYSDPSKIDANLNPPRGESIRNRRSTDGNHGKPELVVPRARAASLPPQPISPSKAENPTRATSLLPTDGHVHPKLPDYEDLAARIAALTGR